MHLISKYKFIKQILIDPKEETDSDTVILGGFNIPLSTIPL